MPIGYGPEKEKDIDLTEEKHIATMQAVMVYRILSITILFTLLCGILLSSTAMRDVVAELSPRSSEVVKESEYDAVDKFDFENITGSVQPALVNQELVVFCIWSDSVDSYPCQSHFADDFSRAPPISS